MSSVFPVTVDYSRAVEDVVRENSCYWIYKKNPQELFQTEKTGVENLQIELLYFSSFISTKEILAEMEARGLCPANLHELLALTKKYQKISCEFAIVALGSIGLYGDYRVAPYIAPWFSWHALESSLNLLKIDRESQRPPCVRFAVVRK